MNPTHSDRKHSSLLNLASQRAHAFSTSVPGTLPSQRIVRVNTPTVSAPYLLTTPTRLTSGHGHPARYSTRANANYNPFANSLPSELRILRSPEAAAKQAVKEAATKEEKENMASRAANLAKEQAEKAAKQEAEAATGTGATVAKSSATAAKTVAPETAAAVTKPKKPLMQRIKDEAVHYWQGTKLLGLELKISSKLLSKVLRGGKLTRREYRQVHWSCQSLLWIGMD